jgi:hypothetical protein
MDEFRWAFCDWLILIENISDDASLLEAIQYCHDYFKEHGIEE